MEDKQQQKQRRQGNKGLLELCIFLAALATGTASSILTKIMYSATDNVNGQHFEKPIAQTLYMFLAMLFGMPMHWLVVAYKIPFPGYYHYNNQQQQVDHDVDYDHNHAAVKDAAVLIDVDATPRINSHKHAASCSSNSGVDEHESLLPPSYAYNNNNNNNNNNEICNDDENDNIDTRDTCTDDDDENNHNDSTDFDNNSAHQSTVAAASDEDQQTTMKIPWKTYLQLCIPAFFDCIATALFMIGLLFLNVSVYQLLRGSGIIFVGLFRQYGLKQTLYQFQWIGLWYNVVSAILVGAAAFLDTSSTTSTITSSSVIDGSMTMTMIQTNNSLEACSIGVTFMLLGTFLDAFEFVLEEKFMVADEVKVPPLLFFGMKGFWGVIITLGFLYPIAYYIPGHDKGSFENFWTAWEMIYSTHYIRRLVILSMIVIFLFNLFCVLVTFLLSSIWHAILDNFRPLTVWSTDLIIYYVIEQQVGVSSEDRLGESWMSYSWLQLAGMTVLIYGTAIYNAPDSGSIRLQGEWYSLGLDFSQEYNKIVQERQGSQMQRTWGSYPSLRGFLNVSARDNFGYDDNGSSIRFGKRANTLQPPATPKMYAPSRNGNARNYSSMKNDLRQHSI